MWLCWKRRFEQFQQESGLAIEDDEKKISTQLYCMGENVEETLLLTKISEADCKKYSEVIGSFDALFQVRKNAIFECARFNWCRQEPEESVEQFITSVYDLAENCSYSDFKDRIVVGICDISLSKHLQLDSELTLEKTKTLVRQREAVQEHQARCSCTVPAGINLNMSWLLTYRTPTKKKYCHATRLVLPLRKGATSQTILPSPKCYLL